MVNFAIALNKLSLMYRETNVSQTAEEHLELSQTSKIEPFVEMVGDFKSYVLDIWVGSKHASLKI